MAEVFNLPTKEQFDTMNSHLANISIPDAAKVTIEDTGSHYTSGNVEGALQEVGAQINTLDALVGLGGVKESGSNANGSYIKFEDGTMICTHTLIFSEFTVATASGSLFTSELMSWTYPATFISPASVSINQGALANYKLFPVVTVSHLTTKAQYMLYSTLSLSNATDLRNSFLAIGRWKA